MKLMAISSLIFLISMNTNFAQNPNAFPVQVQTKHGIIEGNYDTHTGIKTFFGVPFAKPPVGDLRWKAPQPMDDWDGVKETKRFGPRPMQTLVFGDMKSRSDGVSEDCLHLNIWTPATRNTQDLPVLVYFYGGGFVAGDASEYRYDGESMAHKGIVAVTVNYRLNIFGFFAHPELSAESDYGASGNYGLLDQVAALEWVKENISVFGGDPNQVTIAGESAGSISVSYQMASPLAKDLIAGAIGESGAGIHPTLAPVSLEEAEKTGAEFVEKAGFTSFHEFRELTTAEVYEVYNESKRFGFPVVVDGYFLPKKLPEIFEAGEQAQVPLLLGWNSAEIPGQAFMFGAPYEETAYLNRVKYEYPDLHAEILELYPHGSKEEIEYSATALASDRFIAYSTWKWFDLHRKNSDQPVYRYLYSKLRPPLVDQSKTPGLAGGTMDKTDETPPMPEPIGAPHACEIEYCMGNLHLVEDYAWTQEDFKVSQTMQDYFANFIKYSNPNDVDLPKWPMAERDDDTPSIMIIDTESEAMEAKHDSRYVLHDKYYKN